MLGGNWILKDTLLSLPLPSMNTARIQNTLDTFFQDSARWSYPGRRIVFWYDPDQQFASSFNELQFEGNG